MMFSIDAEQAVLGALLLSNDALDAIPWLSTDHFYRTDHRRIFTETKRLYEHGQAVDVITLGDKVELEGESAVSYLHQLVSNTPSAANVTHYAGIVRGHAQRRALAALASEVAEQAISSHDPRAVADFAQSKLESIVQEAAKAEPVRNVDGMPRYLTELKQRAAGEGSKAMPTGFVDLDKRLNGGLQGGQLIVLAGRPKMGKTSLALNIAVNMAVQNSGLFLSMEMPESQLHDRNVAVLSGVPLRKIIDPSQLTENDWPAVGKAVERLERVKLSIDDQGGLTLMDVRAKARLTKRRYGLDFIVIDYLQLMEGEGDSRNTQIENITRGLKSLAKELDVAVILLSQLNRQLEQRPNKRPVPSDLRDSGAIEQDCDVAMFVYRDEVYHEHSPDKGICEVIIPLIRQGEPGTVGLAYIAYLTKFANLDQGQEFGRAPTRQRYANLRD